MKSSAPVKLLSGNEALALGAYHAGVTVAAAYPGTPSSEILESIAKFDGVYAEWSTNEKVAMEVALGASYAGARSLASMKQVGLNVASDPFMAASTTGVDGGIVVISCDDPGIHSSQNEQDNRHYARLAKVPMLEPGDSQEAYEMMALAFDISEVFDTPVLVRSTTRLSHSKSVVRITGSRVIPERPLAFHRNPEKYVMLPTSARLRRPRIEERLVRLAEYAEATPVNQVTWGRRELGIIANGIAYQYAREVFPKASFLKLGMTYPLPKGLIRDFASRVARTVVIEELDPFLEENIRAMGVEVTGKEFIPRIGELTPAIIEENGRRAGLLPPARNARATGRSPLRQLPAQQAPLPKRPPLLCSGCPHAGIYFILSSLGQRSKLPKDKRNVPQDSKLVITGDIGCYTLGAYPPRNALDTCACMGAGIGQALGMEKAGLVPMDRDFATLADGQKIVAVIGDSTFLHSGITPLVNAVYNQGHFTVLILDNGDTAMTGHQPHPGVGVSARGQKTQAVVLEKVVEGIGVKNLKVVDAFNLKALRAALRDSLDSNELSVIIVRGGCSMLLPKRTGLRCVDPEKCNQCEVCLLLGCPAIRNENERIYIDSMLCVGDACTICEQVCPRQAIGARVEAKPPAS